jgi:signal peptidase
MFRSLSGFVWRVLVWLVLGIAVVVLAVGVVVPRLAGATPYNIQTGSMRPHYPPGTLVVIKPTEPSKLQVGQVATYQISSGQPEVATHRIVTIESNLGGQQRFIFKGDANNSPDPSPVRPVQIRGRLLYAVPYLGWIDNAMTGHDHQVLVYGLAASLIGYAGFMFVGAVRDKRRSRRTPIDQGSGEGATA